MDIIPFPVLISKEGKWFVACCPVLDIATQGRTEEEVRENMMDIIEEYMEDPDTQKQSDNRGSHVKSFIDC